MPELNYTIDFQDFQYKPTYTWYAKTLKDAVKTLRQEHSASGGESVRALIYDSHDNLIQKYHYKSTGKVWKQDQLGD